MPNNTDNSKSLKKTQTHAIHTCFFIFVSEKDSFFLAYLTSVTSSISGLELKVINPPFFDGEKKKNGINSPVEVGSFSNYQTTISKS